MVQYKGPQWRNMHIKKIKKFIFLGVGVTYCATIWWKMINWCALLNKCMKLITLYWIKIDLIKNEFKS